MKRSHRAIHRIVWPALVLLIVLGFSMALVLRPPPDAPQAENRP